MIRSTVRRALRSIVDHINTEDRVLLRLIVEQEQMRAVQKANIQRIERIEYPDANTCAPEYHIQAQVQSLLDRVHALESADIIVKLEEIPDDAEHTMWTCPPLQQGKFYKGRGYGPADKDLYFIVRDYPGGRQCIWGFSIYKGTPDYMTIGQNWPQFKADWPDFIWTEDRNRVTEWYKQALRAAGV